MHSCESLTVREADNLFLSRLKEREDLSGCFHCMIGFVGDQLSQSQRLEIIEGINRNNPTRKIEGDVKEKSIGSSTRLFHTLYRERRFIFEDDVRELLRVCQTSSLYDLKIWLSIYAAFLKERGFSTVEYHPELLYAGSPEERTVLTVLFGSATKASEGKRPGTDSFQLITSSTNIAEIVRTINSALNADTHVEDTEKKIIGIPKDIEFDDIATLLENNRETEPLCYVKGIYQESDDILGKGKLGCVWACKNLIEERLDDSRVQDSLPTAIDSMISGMRPVLTRRESSTLRGKSSTYDKMDTLLDIILEKDSAALTRFLIVLDNHRKHARELLLSPLPNVVIPTSIPTEAVEATEFARRDTGIDIRLEDATHWSVPKSDMERLIAHLANPRRMPLHVNAVYTVEWGQLTDVLFVDPTFFTLLFTKHGDARISAIALRDKIARHLSSLESEFQLPPGNERGETYEHWESIYRANADRINGMIGSHIDSIVETMPTFRKTKKYDSWKATDSDYGNPVKRAKKYIIKYVLSGGEETWGEFFRALHDDRVRLWGLCELWYGRGYTGAKKIHPIYYTGMARDAFDALLRDINTPKLRNEFFLAIEDSRKDVRQMILPN